MKLLRLIALGALCASLTLGAACALPRRNVPLGPEITPDSTQSAKGRGEFGNLVLAALLVLVLIPTVAKK